MLTEKAREALRGLHFRHKKRPQLRSICILMVPKAGLEPARISTVDFESTASTDFATSALQVVCGKRVHYTFQRSTCNTYPLFNELSAEKIVDLVILNPLRSQYEHNSSAPLSPPFFFSPHKFNLHHSTYHKILFLQSPSHKTINTLKNINLYFNSTPFIHHRICDTYRFFVKWDG